MKVTRLYFSYRGKENIEFSYDVNVSKDGTFSTTLPQDAVRKIESYGVTLNRNRLGNVGYFSAKTLEELERAVYKVVEDAVSCELVNTEDVIKYQIMISASYCRNGGDETDKELYPNGAGLKGRYLWVDGNVNNTDTSFSVYVKPMTLKRYRYRSGSERVDECPINVEMYPEGSAVRFIDSLVHMSPHKYQKVEHMPCTEENAVFFKKAIVSIWKLNEALGRLLKDNTLELAIKSQKLLDIV